MSATKYFTMSALNALLAIRRYLIAYPGLDAQTVARSIPTIDADNAGCDFETGIELHERISVDSAFGDPAEGLRYAIANIVSWQHPLWVRLTPYGRERVKTALTRDEEQCLRSAGLFEEPPSEAIVLWWDNLAQTARAAANDRLLAQGREAERLSLAYETARLEALQIPRKPKWVAIEDNGAGYDIRSYDTGPVEPIGRLIEVKSSTQNPPRMVLTRNEWETAVKYGDAFVFHIWVLPAEILQERTVAQIAMHVPADQGSGRWSQVEIKIH
ncbi:DUF3883 domain-containing protein [Bradyrhizobium ottawaense]|uniref:Protein NO VEIN C-terminal domain-containing protein n=1 Tax=Bradyrhizobium ottawaense TaxID=931866 RepID=A0ABY0QHK7_9BRAD|nr:DUF3883 domain-containing protein [Bradyrhizobium ottawaense]SDK39228.1 protein of unknown function [Bradyrhizobium ottawaense]SDK47178.1 protein of unknown function [Bradyrhizobium ottawaense]